MIKYKNKLILNADYYSADAYMLGEEEKRSFVKTMIKPLMIIFMSGLIIVGATYFIKNNFETISSGFSDVKNMLIFENRTPIVIRKEPETINNAIEAIVIREEIMLVERINDVISSNKVEPKVIESEALNDEYIKLMQKSLGNY